MKATSYRILLVEDDPDDRIILEDLLEEVRMWRPEVVWAATYDEGVRQVTREPFDIALVDYRLGARRGIEFVGEIAVRNAGLPVVILTGQSGREADLAAAEAGAADFLPKQGLDATLLERTVRYTVESHRRHRMEARYRAMAEYTRDLTTILNSDGTIRYATPSMQHLLGYDPAEQIGRSLMQLVHPADRADLQAEFDKLVGKPGATLHSRYRITRRDGVTRVFDTVAQNLVSDPLIGGVIMNSWDITELRATKERTRFQADLLDRVGQAVIAVDDERRVTYWNHAAEALYGYSAAEVMGRHMLSDIVAPSDVEKAQEAYAAAVTGWDGELCMRARDGRHIDMQMTITPAINPDGSVGGFIAVGADITRLRRAEKEREAASERVRFQAGLLDAVAQAVIATDLDGTITYWNRAAENLYGWSAAEALGRSVLDVTPAAGSRERALAIMETLRAGDTWSGELEMQRVDGTSFHALVANAPILDEDGQLVGVIGVSSDVTERRLLEDQLRQAQKMEAIGRLAGGVAHDFNNLLTAIKGHSALLLEDLPADSPHADDVDQILRSADRAAALTRQLLAFSRKQLLEERSVDLADVVLEMKPMLLRLVPERIALIVEEAESCVVRADPSQLTQVVMNLVVNAADAIEASGRIILRVEKVDLSPEDIAAIPWPVDAGSYAQLAVIDDGSGMAPAVLERIFEPFFTTKGEGRGTGLGLSTVYGIVKQSAGHVITESEPGVGTSFRVLLPRHAGEADQVQQPEASAHSFEGGVILLVEDDAAVRALARRVLNRAGYDVLHASDGREALRLAEQYSTTIDLVLSDVVMPELGGVELADHLRERYPGLKVVLTSGYSEAEVSGAVRRRGSAFLVKPFTPESLLRVVAETLASRR